MLILLSTALMLSSMPVYAADIDSMTFEELKEAYLELEEKYNSLIGEETSNTESDGFSYSAEGFTYKYLKNEVKNIDGTDYVFVFFEYTNDSGESSIPCYSLTVTAFQNGIEIDSFMSMSDGIPEAERAFKEIKNGTTTDIALKFELSDDSPIELEISPMIVFGDTPIGEYKFELNK